MIKWLLWTCLSGSMMGMAGWHGLLIDVRVDKAHLIVEAYFDDDTPAVDAEARLEKPSGEILAQGKTDQRGTWRTLRPEPGTYQVSVNAGLGHKATKKVVISAAMEVALNQPPSGAGPRGTPHTSTASMARPSRGAADPIATSQIVSEGPTRQEYFDTLWIKILIGLAVIAALGLAAWLAKREPPATVQREPTTEKDRIDV